MSKYIYWVKKDLFGCFRERRSWQLQCNRFERGRRNRNVNYSASIRDARSFALNTYLVVNQNKVVSGWQFVKQGPNIIPNTLPMQNSMGLAYMQAGAQGAVNLWWNLWIILYKLIGFLTWIKRWVVKNQMSIIIICRRREHVGRVKGRVWWRYISNDMI